ncbi:MAG TPA: lipid II flippase MurJ [Burkholderiales bacterium]
MWTATPTYSIRLILNSALWLTAAGIVVRGCGAVREISFAAAFGVSRETDLFLLAATYATFVPSVLAGALGAALVAQLVRLRIGGTFPRGPALLALAQGICISGVVAALATFLLAPVLVRLVFGLHGADLAEAVKFSRILAPLGVTMVIAASMDALLNSAKQFFIPGVTSAATPIASIAAILLFGRHWGVDAAAWGMVAGGLFEVAILALTIKRQNQVLFGNHGASGELVNLAAFWRAVSFLLLSGAVAAVSPLIDQVFLAKLEVGAITTFNYASKVNSLLIGLFGTAFAVAIYPYLTDLAAQRDMRGLKHLSWRIVALIVPVTVLASMLVFIFSQDIVQLLFARGNFTDKDTELVASIQRVFAFQLVFYVAGLVAMRVLNALQTADFVLWISCLGVLLNATLDWFLYARMGAAGIALSSVLTSIGSLAFALLFIQAASRRAQHGSLQ